MAPRLKSLAIENFRSIRGHVVIPLDAQVILVHGTNGMGKTSVLSALELGLGGAISHLDDTSKYPDFLTNIGTEGGSINLTVEGIASADKNAGTVSFAPGSFYAVPALDEVDIRYFSERAYLPQAVLGRLLEIYDQKKTTNSRLTQFVKNLLRLDPLDALVDGLDHAFNVVRVRKIAPAYKQLEDANDRLKQQVDRTRLSANAAQEAVNVRRTRLHELLQQLSLTTADTQASFEVSELRVVLAQHEIDQKTLSELAQDSAEIAALTARLSELDDESTDYDLAAIERAEAYASSEYQSWLIGPGVEINMALDELRRFHTELLPTDATGLDVLVAGGVDWCVAEAARCQRLLDQHEVGSKQLAAAQTVVQRANARIQEINQLLEAGAKDARTLASALAGVAPHVSGDMCPVCSRDFAELEKGSLTAHIAATIASLTTEAGRLQSLSNERANESEKLIAARRDEVSAERLVLEPDTLVEWRRRQSAVMSIRGRLEELHDIAAQGQGLVGRLNEARTMLASARRRHLGSTSLLPDIQSAVERVTDRPLSSYDSLQEGLGDAARVLSERQEAVHQRLSLRVTAAHELDHYEREFQSLSERLDALQEQTARAEKFKRTFSAIGDIRESAKSLANAASRVRSGIVRDVFSGSLNTVWRDLFVRLAPNEQFVPQFRLPESDNGKIEAVLETFHRSGQSSGPPGAMLSQGNLNTAALTLFLALNLSVPVQLPWLVLDDPVQSMDDVHTAQFAALLRTFSKGLGKQIIVAVHERALFDYLTLELSPAFPGDSLITIELSRNFNGDTVADPRYVVFEPDKAVAA